MSELREVFPQGVRLGMYVPFDVSKSTDRIANTENLDQTARIGTV